ncbi:MAG: MBL fold metallo-hydrolase [Maricaulaceae bacterium]
MSLVLRATVLGCGSAGGVPRVGGEWGACDPNDPRNRRSRCSLLVEQWRDDAPDRVTRVLVDTSPDLRAQLLAVGVGKLDAVLYTHDHADQSHGIDDLRPIVINQRRPIAAYMSEATAVTLRHRFDYIFDGANGYPPLLNARDLPTEGEIFGVLGAGDRLMVTPFSVEHGPIEAHGFRFGPLVYIPDVSAIPEPAWAAIDGAQVWVLDALRWRPHPTHAHVARALEWLDRSGVARGVLTNLHVDLDYAALDDATPAHIEPAVDGLTMTFRAEADDWQMVSAD